MKWHNRAKEFMDETLKKELSEKLGLKEFVISVLVNRGITDFEKAKAAFEIDSIPLNDPFLFEDMEKAVNTVLDAVSGNKNIVIYGDYDVDGVTSTVILYRFIKEKLGCPGVDYYIPHRQDEGYGINAAALDNIREAGASLVITVDCGINAGKEISEAKQKGLDVIVTDHHIPEESKVPSDAAAIINPKYSKKYPGKDLAGVGVAYKLICAIAERKGIRLGDDYLDFVALGTVADIVPLSEENRILVRKGLKQTEKSLNPGLYALKNAAGIKPGIRIDSYHVGFILGPRINAAGRLEHAKKAVELFISSNEAEIEDTAAMLNSINDERKKVMNKTRDEAIAMTDPVFNAANDFVIVVYNEKWNAGIVGLVASKLTDRFKRPSFVLTRDENGIVHGSARSVPSVDIYEAIKAAASSLIKFGGHTLAAGVTLREDKIDEFRKMINDYLHKNKKEDDFESIVFIDDEIRGSITIKDMEIFDKLQPWGEGNPKPLFVMRNVEVRDVRLFKNSTMKFYARFNGVFYNFLYFGYSGEDEEKIKQGVFLDIVFSPKVDTWRDRESLTLEVKDYRQV